MARVVLAVNPSADRGRASAAGDRIEQRIRHLGHDVVRAEAADAAALTRRVADLLAEASDQRLVVAGGDGLLHHLLPVVAGSDTVVGVVPVGTGNDFVRGAGLVVEQDRAVEVALGPWRPLDAIRVGDRWVASVGTAGFSGRVTQRANTVPWPRGRMRYSVATLIELPRLRPFPLTLCVDGESLRTSCSLIAVANTPHFGGGMAICPDARPDDGLLEVTLVDAVSPLTLGRFFPRVFAGTHLTHPAVVTRRGRVVELEADGVDDIDLWGDGERMAPLPARLECVPGALRLAGAARPPRPGHDRAS